MTTIQANETLQAVLNKIYSKRTEAAKERLAELIRIKAPEIIIENERKLTQESRWQTEVESIIKKAQKKEGITGDLEITSVERRTGKGGKPWFVLNSAEGKLSFFPLGRHGAFIKRGAEINY